MERRTWYAVCAAVLLGLGASGAAKLAAANEGGAAGEAVQPLGKLGVAPVAPGPTATEELEHRLAARGMKLGSPILIRIFKSEAELEVWVDSGTRFELFATYPICNWSGTLGPKLAEGDKQSPEGLYSISARQLRRSARWRRSLDIGFPNTFDRASRRTGSDVLLHGGCTSTGCYAMTDPVIEELFQLSNAALAHGQKRIQVHAFPFRMTPENLVAHADSEWKEFWTNLKEAYDLFERTRLAPSVSVCNNRYVVGETASGEAGCDENISAAEVEGARRVHFARRRMVRIRAYAAARRARLAARIKQQQALHAGAQRKLPR